MALWILTAAIATLLLFVSGLFSLLTPFPLLYLYSKRGLSPALAAVGMAFVLLFFSYNLRFSGEVPSFLPGRIFYPSLALDHVRLLSLVSFSHYVTIGLALGWFGRRSSTWEWGILKVVAAAVTVSTLLFFLVFRGTPDPLAAFHEGLKSIMEKLVQLSPELPPGERELLSGSLVEVLWRILPSLWVIFTLTIVASNLILIRRWLPEGPIQAWRDFPLWRLGERWIWGPVTLGFLYFFNSYLLKEPYLGWGCLNGLIVLAAVYFSQGLSILTFFLQRKFSPMTRILMIFFLVLLANPGMILLIFLGLFDFWFDFRKRVKQ